MKILAYNTANNFCSVALSVNHKIVAYLENLNNSIQAEKLIPMIESCLSRANTSYAEIDWLVVANGPGSFTGIRTGLACAQGILLCLNINGVAVSNFELAYFKAKEQINSYGKIYVILNAYRSQVYVQVFNFSGEKSQASLLDVGQLIEMLTNENSFVTQNITENIICTGDAIEAIYQDIAHLKNLIILPRFAKIKAHHICKYAHQAFKNHELIPNLMSPLYIRTPDAKIAS